jgi:hypothetical protein
LPSYYASFILLFDRLAHYSRTISEREYHALKEALYIAKRYTFAKDFIISRIGFINELTEEEIKELCSLGETADADGDDDEEEEEEEEEKPEGFSKENILRRLQVDLEHVNSILCESVLKNEANRGEIDGGGDDGGGKGGGGDDEIDDSEFQDAR